MTITTYESDIYVATTTMLPGEKKAFVHRWNSAASVSNPSTKVWLHRQDVSADVLTGSDSASLNIQTGKFFEAPAESWGNHYVYEWSASVEGQTLKKWLRVIIASLPR